MTSKIKCILVPELAASHALFLGSSSVEAKEIPKIIEYFHGTRLLVECKEKITYVAIDCYKDVAKKLHLSIGHGETKNVMHMRQINRNSEIFGLCMMYMVGVYRAVEEHGTVIFVVDKISDRVKSYKNQDNFKANLLDIDQLDNSFILCEYTNSQFRAAYVKVRKDVSFPAAPKLAVHTDTAIKV